MKNSEIAKVYAVAAADMAKDASAPIFKEIADFVGLLNSSTNLENILFLNVFHEEEKIGVLQEVLEKCNFHALTKNFLLFILKQQRLGLIPQIYKELTVMEDAMKGFIKTTVEGPLDELEQDVKSDVESFLFKKLNKTPVITYKKNDSISAGYKVSAGDYLLDATLKTQLQEFKKSFFQ